MGRIWILLLAALLLSGCVGKKTEPGTTVNVGETVEEIYTFAEGETK